MNNTLVVVARQVLKDISSECSSVWAVYECACQWLPQNELPGPEEAAGTQSECMLVSAMVDLPWPHPIVQ